MSSLEAKLNALETETQLKINRQFLKRLDKLESTVQILEQRIIKLETEGGKQ